MDQMQSKQILGSVSSAPPSGQWGDEPTAAAQRAPAELYVLNVCNRARARLGAP